MAKKHPVLPLLALGAVLAFAAALRWGTFYTGHMGGDQTYYTALAMKLDASGIGGYTLRNTGIRPGPGGRYADLTLLAPSTYPLMDFTKDDGMKFYDVPLFYTPPLFAKVLGISHAAFPGDGTFRIRPPVPLKQSEFHADTLYAALPPFLFGLGTILLTALLAWRHFGGPWTGVMAAAFLAASPVDALAASRVWPDSMAAFFLALSFLLYLEARARQKLVLSFAGGAALGLAVLSKGTALFFVPSVILACAIAAWRRAGLKEVGRTIVDMPVFLYLGAAFVVTLPWHVAMIMAYGNPFYSAPFPKGGTGTATWFDFVRGRSWLVYPLNTLFQNPAFLLWLLPLRRLIRNKPIHEPDLQAFLFPVVLTIMLLLAWPGREERYFLVAYPALAVTAAASLDRFRRLFDRGGRKMGTLLAVAVTVGSMAWSFGLAYVYLYIWQSDIVPVPF